MVSCKHAHGIVDMSNDSRDGGGHRYILPLEITDFPL